MGGAVHDHLKNGERMEWVVLGKNDGMGYPMAEQDHGGTGTTTYFHSLTFTLCLKIGMVDTNVPS